jgi:hypothetical protein
LWSWFIFPCFGLLYQEKFGNPATGLCWQCDQIGRNFAIWAIIFYVVPIFSEKCCPMIWAHFFSKKISAHNPPN